MQVGGPVLFIQLPAVSVRIITETGDIVAERVQPNIDHVSLIEIHGDTPLEGASGYAEILQSGKEEVVHHLILPGYGLDEFGVCVYIIYKSVGIFAHTEEVGFFLRSNNGTAALRALSVHYLRVGPE